MSGTIEGFVNGAPETMRALMKEFVEKKDVNSRVSTRLRMKALLDFVSVDTEFPPNPLDKKAAPPEPAREQAMLGFSQGDAQYVAPVRINGAVPIAGVDPERIDNGDILGS